MKNLRCSFVFVFVLLTTMPTFAQDEYSLPEDRQTITVANASEIAELATIEVEGVVDIALAPDGSILAYGSNADNLVHLVDLVSGEEFAALPGHTYNVLDLAFSPDGSMLATADTVFFGPPDGSVRLWDMETLEEIVVIQTATVGGLVFNPSGTMLTGVVSVGVSSQIKLWDIPSGNELGEITSSCRATFIPNGNLLATCLDDSILIWDLETAQARATFNVSEDIITVVAVSPDGSSLATGDLSGTIRLWDVESGEELSVFEGYQGTISQVTFSPDGNLLAARGQGHIQTISGNNSTFTSLPADAVVRLWDLESEEQIALLGEEGGVREMEFDAEWTLLAIVQGNMIRLWGVL